MLAPAQCHFRLAPIAGADGLFAGAVCTMNGKLVCPHRTAALIEAAREIDGLPVISSGRPLTGPGGWAYFKKASAYDVMPYLDVFELFVAHKWARDYSRRRVPWLLAANGAVFSFYKRKTTRRAPVGWIKPPPGIFKPVNSGARDGMMHQTSRRGGCK